MNFFHPLCDIFGFIRVDPEALITRQSLTTEL
jgi:hypothetical protein